MEKRNYLQERRKFEQVGKNENWKKGITYKGERKSKKVGKNENWKKRITYKGERKSEEVGKNENWKKYNVPYTVDTQK